MKMYRWKVVYRRKWRMATSASRVAFALNKERALAIVTDRISHFNTIYNFQIGKVSIKNQTTRWGSCSKKGNLNFNYRIVNLPPELQDYLVVHELCHLQEFNHSKAFWDLMGKAIPDYRARRQALRAIHVNRV